jgi:Predicted metal-dependent membrane protease
MIKIFKNQYGELRCGWAIAAVLGLIIIAQLVGASLAPENAAPDDIETIFSVTIVYSLIAIGGGILLFKLIYNRRLREVGLIRESLGWDLLHGFVIGTASMSLIFVVLLLTGQAETYFSAEKLFSIVTLANFISVGLTAFSEELLARGFIMTALKTTRKKWAILCVSSIIFSLVHLLNPGATALSLINTFLAGLIFAAMFVKSGKLWLSSGFHFAWNFFEGDIFGMNVSGREQWSIFSTDMGKYEFLTGGNAGPEGGLIVTCVLILGFLYVLYFVKKPKRPLWTMESGLPLVRL